MNKFLMMSLIVIVIGIILLIGLVIYFIRKKSCDKPPVFYTKTVSNTSMPLIENRQSGELTLPLELLEATTNIHEMSLYEITDHSVISRLSQIIPNAADTVLRTASKNKLEIMEVYRAIIPSDVKLAKSQNMAGAVRGFFHGSKKVKGHADLVRVDPSKTIAVANSFANIMNVGSIIVGQYYMAKVNSKLRSMGKTIDKISDFQDCEFKSGILSLIAQVGKISLFSCEILESDELRNRKLQTLDDLEGKSVQLLQQVNCEVSKTIKKNQKQSYKEYQENVDVFATLIERQQHLLSVLEQISKLVYLFGKGESSSEMCYSMYNTCLEQSNTSRAVLEKWHQQQLEILSIDIEKNRKNKTGVEGFLATFPGLIDEKWNYKVLADGLGSKINAQKTTAQIFPSEPNDVYDKDVQIIIKEGKYYYLPHNSEHSDVC